MVLPKVASLAALRYVAGQPSPSPSPSQLASQRSSMLWVVHCADTPGPWEYFAKLFAALPAGSFDALSPLSYAILEDGSFGYKGYPYVDGCGQHAEEVGFPVLAGLGVKLFSMVHVMGSAGDGMLATMDRMYAQQEQWIASAVQRAEALGFDGYNLDLEINFATGTETQARNMADFIDAFGAALHAKGKSLSSDIGGCPGGFNGAYTCDRYAAGNTDEVITMETYWLPGGRVGSLAAFKDEVQKALTSLGGQYKVGLNLDMPVDVMPEALAFLTKQHVRRVSVWHGGDVGVPSAGFAQALADWTNAPETGVLSNAIADSQSGPLRTGQHLSSPAGVAHVAVRADGRLCVGHGPAEAGGEAVWCSSAAKQATGQFRTIVQVDGNLCVVAADDTPVWCALGASLPHGAYHAAVGDDCSFCLFDGEHANSAPIWCGTRGPCADAALV